jgi:serine/threonine protein kinase/WD40 repeat protein
VSDETIFAAALAIGSPGERAAYLDRACAGQPALRREVDELLAAHAADNPLDRPAADIVPTGTYQPAEPPPAVVGERIGPYRLMEQIGEGGFGRVFVAEQAEPVRRKVALKVLKPGMDTRDVVARFEAERQALALMDHPNIARVLDAGSTQAGRPYFVMELVRGVSITDYCDQHKLPPHDRLALFVQVCQAVQHAHQKGIIHRDLKPSNILVTSHDGVPVPKVIDFGVAKAVGQSLTEKTIYTRFAQMIGTPLYMSPEQAEMSGLDVDTRSDVYALGVLLYELLTGTTPFDRARFKKAAFDEIRRIIREEEPPRPSTRLSTLGATLPVVSANRQTDAGKLAGVVRGELDWIVMRCLEKDRNRRYDSANTLAKDVQRYLSGDAVEACPPTVGYRLRKFARRHKRWVIFTAILIPAVIVSLVLQTLQIIRAQRAEADAAQQRDEAIEAHEAAERERKKVADVNESLRRLAEERQRTLYATSLNLAQAAWDTGDTARTLELLRQQLPGPGESDLRGFEWHYWRRQAQRDVRTIQLADFQGTDWANTPPALSPDGRLVAGVGTSARLKVWDAATGRLVRSVPVPAGLSPEGFVAFSHDGRRVAAARLHTGSPDGAKGLRTEVSVWDTADGTRVYGGGPVADMMMAQPALSADGTHLAVCWWPPPGSARHTTLSLRRLSDGAELLHHSAANGPTMLTLPTFSPDGRRVAAASHGGAQRLLHVWDITEAREVVSITIALPQVGGVRFSPDGRRLAVRAGDDATDQVLLFDTASGATQQVLALPPPPARVAPSMPLIAFSPAGTRLAVPQGTRVYLFDLGAASGTAPVARALHGHASHVLASAFSPDGAQLVSLDARGTVKTWDPAASERHLHTSFGRFAYRPGARPSTDGTRVATVAGGIDPKPWFRLQDETGRRIHEQLLPPGHCDDLQFAADGSTVALSWHDGVTLTLYVWDARTGKERFRVSPPGGMQNWAALSPDGSRLVATSVATPNEAGWSLATLDCWDVATGQLLFQQRGLRADYLCHAACSPDGRHVVINPGLAADRDCRLVWLDARTGAEVRTVQFGADAVAGFGFSPDGQRFAAGRLVGDAPMIDVWDTAAVLRGDPPTPLVRLVGHGEGLFHCVFSPDGRRILTSGGGVVKLWDSMTGRELLALRGGAVPAGEAYFSPDGRTIWGGLDEHGRLWGWDGAPVEGKQP